MEAIDIAGAGISGLTAAIHLARNGFRVRIFDKGPDVSSRYKDELQGLENWSTIEDVLIILETIGISPHFYYKPLTEVDAVNDQERIYSIGSAYRTAVYIVKRGKAQDSIDQYLKRKALDLGVEITYGLSPKDRDVRIIAKGPQSFRAVAYGISADVIHRDRIAILLDDQIAPKGYAYLLIADGKMTLASVLMEQFHRAKECFRLALERVKRLYDLNPEKARPMGGYGYFDLRSSYVIDGKLLVGEYAGLQDYLFGFGMRYAVLSGYLAAKSIIERLNYDQLIKKEMGKMLKSSLVNRYFFEKWGNQGYRRLIQKWYKSDDVFLFMNRWYSWRFYKTLLWLFARIWFYKKEKMRTRKNQ